MSNKVIPGTTATRLAAALRAIVARIDGEWDQPDLQAFGGLTTIREDVKAIAEDALNLEGYGVCCGPFDVIKDRPLTVAAVAGMADEIITFLRAVGYAPTYVHGETCPCNNCRARWLLSKLGDDQARYSINAAKAPKPQEKG